MNHSLLMKKVNCRRLGKGRGGGCVCYKLSVNHSETKQNHMNRLCCCEQTSRAKFCSDESFLGHSYQLQCPTITQQLGGWLLLLGKHTF